MQSSILDGLISTLKQKGMKKDKQQELDSDPGSDFEITEATLKEAEKNLTAEDRLRIQITEQRQSLPMYQYRDELLAAIRDN